MGQRQNPEKIKNLLKPTDLIAAVLVLVNAIYFKGEWADPFDKAQTKDGDFYLVNNTAKTMPMMSRRPRPGQDWHPAFAKIGREKGTIILPCFKIECEKSLLGHFADMGLTANNFNRMSDTEGFFISKVIHKTFLDVNEEGAEAAAATAVVMSRGLSAPPFKMVVDRPFFCAIQDNLTGAILFMGTIYESEIT